MNIYIPLAIILIIIGYLSRKSSIYSKKIFLATFVVMLVFDAIRYEFGPDYFQYRYMYDEVSAYGADSYSASNTHIENLFVKLLQLFPSYYLFVVFQSSLWLLTTYFFLRNKIDTFYLWFILLLLFFDTNYFINNTVAMRSSIASSIVIIGYTFLMKNKRIVFVLLALLAFLIHTSAIVALLILFINEKRTIFNLSFYRCKIIILVCGILAVVFANTLMVKATNYLFDLFPSIEEEYAVYQSMNSVDLSGLDYLKRSLLVVFNLFPILSVINHLEHEDCSKYIKIEKITILFLFFSMLLGMGITGRFLMLVGPIILIGVARSFRSLSAYQTIAVIVSMSIVAIYSFYNIMLMPYSYSFWQYKTILP